MSEKISRSLKRRVRGEVLQDVSPVHQPDFVVRFLLLRHSRLLWGCFAQPQKGDVLVAAVFDVVGPLFGRNASLLRCAPGQSRDLPFQRLDPCLHRIGFFRHLSALRQIYCAVPAL